MRECQNKVYYFLLCPQTKTKLKHNKSNTNRNAWIELLPHLHNIQLKSEESSRYVGQTIKTCIQRHLKYRSPYSSGKPIYVISVKKK